MNWLSRLSWIIGTAIIYEILRSKVTPRIHSALSKTYLKLPDSEKKSWDIRPIVIFDGLILGSLSLYSFSLKELVDDPIFYFPAVSEISLCILCGYLLTDLLWMMFCIEWEPIYATHHTITGLLGLLCLDYGRFGYFVAMRTSAELSVPLFQLGHYLKDMNMKNTIYFKILAGLFAFTFAACRILTIPIYYWKVYRFCWPEVGYRVDTLPFVFLTIFAACADALNIFWFSRLVKSMLRMFRHGAA